MEIFHVKKITILFLVSFLCCLVFPKTHQSCLKTFDKPMDTSSLSKVPFAKGNCFDHQLMIFIRNFIYIQRLTPLHYQ